jgi:hypothetical protein
MVSEGVERASQEWFTGLRVLLQRKEGLRSTTTTTTHDCEYETNSGVLAMIYSSYTLYKCRMNNRTKYKQDQTSYKGNENRARYLGNMLDKILGPQPPPHAQIIVS